jgi:probable rRNA maturation factor
LLVNNRQKLRRLNLRLLRQLLRRIVEECRPPRGQGGQAQHRTRGQEKGNDLRMHLPPCGAEESLPAGGQLGVSFLQAADMARLNEQFLRHAGSTDVITFNYAEDAALGQWCGEIFVSVEDAVACAPRFRATWQLELARYLVHGVLHLLGFDDLRPAARREMKSEENRVLKKLSRNFDWNKLEQRNHAP